MLGPYSIIAAFTKIAKIPMSATIVVADELQVKAEFHPHRGRKSDTTCVSADAWRRSTGRPPRKGSGPPLQTGIRITSSGHMTRSSLPWIHALGRSAGPVKAPGPFTSSGPVRRDRRPGRQCRVAPRSPVRRRRRSRRWRPSDRGLPRTHRACRFGV